ncbi:hypothetical protein WJX73_009237 [Symbiochloris irregularis]|uniref:Uncharacterized protein n=1 Tax=Symbiochloris irregularis TaxID=706552 RepID=A0AAW1NZB6_9CHLO
MTLLDSTAGGLGASSLRPWGASLTQTRQAGSAFLTAVAAVLCSSVDPSTPNTVELPEDVWRMILALLVIDFGRELAKRGISGPSADAFLDASPCLHLSVWCGARSHCCSRAAAKLILCGREDLPDVLRGGGIFSKLRWSWTGESTGGLFQQPGSFCWDSGIITLVPDTWACISADIQGYAAGPRFAVVFIAGRSAEHCHDNGGGSSWHGRQGGSYDPDWDPSLAQWLSRASDRVN